MNTSTSSTRDISKKALILYIGLLFFGFVAGIATYTEYLSGDRAVETEIAGTHAITLHVIIAALVVTGIVIINTRIRKDEDQGIHTGLLSGDGGFWKAPFSHHGWGQIMYAILALPIGVAQFLCTVVGAVHIAYQLERWRLSRYLGVSLPAIPHDLRKARLYFVGGLFSSILLTAGAYFVCFTIWRAGLQIIGGFDPNFNVNAWGGPSQLGAALAHWLDAFVIITMGIVIVRTVSAQQARRAVQLLDGSLRTK